MALIQPFAMVGKKVCVVMYRRFFSFIILLSSLAFLNAGCNSRTLIAHGLLGRDANEIVVLLVSKGISAEKSPMPTGAVGGTSTEQLWDIAVPSSQITEALAILNQAGLPRLKGTSLLDLFAKQSLVPSELQERIRYQEGLSEQLATTIRKMDGIMDANVQVSFPTEGEENVVMTASVYIKHRGILDNPNSVVVSKIKRLVASAIPGLIPENVSVVGDRASYSEISLNGPWGLTDEVEYASVWGVIMAKQSVVRFRTIFYCFLLGLFVVSSILLWILWKAHTMIIALGGIKTLFSPAPYHMITPKPSDDNKETADQEAETKDNEKEVEQEAVVENSTVEAENEDDA
ncbi:MAG: type III secretion inner membrane ring lipoprotein SctJ [Victivallaceae bacterium]